MSAVNFLSGHIIDVTIFYCRGKYPSIFCHIVFKIYCIKILKGSNYHHHPYLSHSTFQTDNHQKGLKCIFWYKLLTATSICSHKLNEFVLTKNCLDKILTFQSGYWKMKWFWKNQRSYSFMCIALIGDEAYWNFIDFWHQYVTLISPFAMK